MNAPPSQGVGLHPTSSAPPLTAGCFANLIVTSTFYHVVLACLIARDARFPGASLLVVNPRRSEMATVYAALAQAPDSPFAATLQMPVYALKKPARERAQAAWLQRIDAEARTERLIVFSDLTPDLQLLLRRAQKRGAQTFCGEDGGAAYSSRSTAARRKRHLQRMLRFGVWIQNVAATGSSRHVQTFLALHPDLVRPELAGKAVWPFEQTALSGLWDSSWVERFLAHYGVSRSELACDELYAPANSRRMAAPDQLRSRLAESIRASRAAGLDCVVKYHPREQGDFLGAAALGARILPVAVPVELVYLASGARLRRVVGDIGTTLLSARWLVPQAEAVSALSYVGVDDPWYARTLERLGVRRLA